MLLIIIVRQDHLHLLGNSPEPFNRMAWKPLENKTCNQIIA